MQNPKLSRDIWASHVLPLLPLETVVMMRQASRWFQQTSSREVISRTLSRRWLQRSDVVDEEDRSKLAIWRLGIRDITTASQIQIAYDRLVREASEMAKKIESKQRQGKQGLEREERAQTVTEEKKTSAFRRHRDGSGRPSSPPSADKESTPFRREDKRSRKKKAREQSDEETSFQQPIKNSRTLISPETTMDPSELLITSKLHHFISDAVYEEVGDAPPKLTAEFHEWVHFTPASDNLDLMDDFRREMLHNRDRGVLSRKHAEWERRTECIVSELRRIVSVCWAVGARKLFPFTPRENKEWKHRKQARLAAQLMAANGDGAKLRLNAEELFLRAIHTTAIVTAATYGFDDLSPISSADSVAHVMDISSSETPSDIPFDIPDEEFSSEGEDPTPTPPPSVSHLQSSVSSPTVDTSRIRNRPVTTNSYRTDYVLLLFRFMRDLSPEARVLRFPPGLSNRDRKRIHQWTRRLSTRSASGWGKGSKSYSFGEGAERFVAVVKDGVEVTNI
ncbi:hypothetical protein HDU93_006162 [Gonapodya sp. JEL0774]|nr:hypothetical protein HDU93_006162 [Gonapodya sp. JEL0774]